MMSALPSDKLRASMSPMPPLPAAAAARIAEFQAEMEKQTSTFVGYPCSQDFDYSEITPLLRFSLNNVGDPFGESIYRQNTFAFEREVIFFSKTSARSSGTNVGLHHGGRHGGKSLRPLSRA